jgi:hypothetical protein
MAQRVTAPRKIAFPKRAARQGLTATTAPRLTPMAGKRASARLPQTRTTQLPRPPKKPNIPQRKLARVQRQIRGRHSSGCPSEEATRRNQRFSARQLSARTDGEVLTSVEDQLGGRVSSGPSPDHHSQSVVSAPRRRRKGRPSPYTEMRWLPRRSNRAPLFAHCPFQRNQ